MRVAILIPGLIPGLILGLIALAGPADAQRRDLCRCRWARGGSMPIAG